MNKNYLIYGLIGLFTIAMASAALVNYYGQMQVTMSIESPIIMNAGITNVGLIAGNGYNLYLVEGENLLERDVDVEVKFSLLDGEGSELVDTDGFYLAYSDDIQYAYSEDYGNVSDWDAAQVWMNANLDWFDWYATENEVNYDASVITNHEGDSFYNALAFNTAIPEDLAPGKFYAVVYLDIDEAVKAGDYTFSVDIIPIVA